MFGSRDDNESDAMIIHGSVVCYKQWKQ